MTIETATLAAGGPNHQFSTREVPWMKLGKLVDEPMKASEAAEAGGLNFNVTPYPAAFLGPEGHVVRIANRVVMVRDDTGVPLSIMSNGYQILQYGDAFDFMDGVSPTYVAAGTLHGGKQGFMVVRAPEHTLNVLGGDDPHDLFIVLRTSHDGTRAVEASIMPLRTRCMNQLTLKSFSSGVKHRWSVKHTTNMQAKLKEAEAALTKLGAYGAAYERLAQRLAAITLTEGQGVSVLMDVLPNKPRRPEQIEKIITSAYQSPTVGYVGTGWGLLQAVSEYYDWGRSGGNPESRFLGALQGVTHTIINKTTQELLKLSL